MHARLMTLNDLTRGASAATRARNDTGLAALAALAAPTRRRDADAGAFDQWKLREFVQSLVTAFGYRDDFKGTSTPWRVPYIPLPFAGEMIDYFTKQSRHWLDASVPTEAKQPNFIKNWTARASEIVGKVERGRVVTPNPDSYEDAPAAVAAKAPAMFKADVPAGQPHAKALKAGAAWRLLDALVRLAIHFDALRGQPTKIDIFTEAVKEQAASVAEKSAEALEHVAELPGKIVGFAPSALKWAAVAVVGLGALYVVTR
jgi:hypothetical protein